MPVLETQKEVMAVECLDEAFYATKRRTGEDPISFVNRLEVKF